MTKDKKVNLITGAILAAALAMTAAFRHQQRKSAHRWAYYTEF